MVGGIKRRHLVVRRNVVCVWSVSSRKELHCVNQITAPTDLNYPACEMFSGASKVEVNPLCEMRWIKYC